MRRASPSRLVCRSSAFHPTTRSKPRERLCRARPSCTAGPASLACGCEPKTGHITLCAPYAELAQPSPPSFPREVTSAMSGLLEGVTSQLGERGIIVRPYPPPEQPPALASRCVPSGKCRRKVRTPSSPTMAKAAVTPSAVRNRGPRGAHESRTRPAVRRERSALDRSDEAADVRAVMRIESLSFTTSLAAERVSQRAARQQAGPLFRRARGRPRDRSDRRLRRHLGDPRRLARHDDRGASRLARQEIRRADCWCGSCARRSSAGRRGSRSRRASRTLVAQNLYRKYGFITVSTRRAYYSDNGENAVVMWAGNLRGELYGNRLAALEERLARVLATPRRLNLNALAREVRAHLDSGTGTSTT